MRLSLALGAPEQTLLLTFLQGAFQHRAFTDNPLIYIYHTPFFSNHFLISSGNRWGQAYKDIDAAKVRVIGRRDWDVGVGGLVGGGMSYFSGMQDWTNY